MSTAIDFEQSLLDQCEAIWDATRLNEEAERLLRELPPLVRLWDGDWKLQHICSVEYSGLFDLIEGDSGPGTLPVPFDSPVGRWLHDMNGRLQRGEKRNVHITVEYGGVRWGGRLENATLEKNDDGDQVVTASFLSDYENLKWYNVRSNPFLPAAVQIPRVFILPGPVPWVAATTLFLQLLREQTSAWAVPDDPANFKGWFNLDQSNWSVVVKPISFIESMASGVVWGVADSRWKNYHEVMQAMLQDAEVTPVLRRYLDGDPPPWPGANLRHGCLVVSFEDKSGYLTGTSHGGSVFDGLQRTITSFTSDFIDSTTSLLNDNSFPPEYFQPGFKSTHKSLPYAVWRDGEETGIQNYKQTTTLAKGIQVLTGGHSMPGVDETIGAGIQALGDILGNLAQIGSIGGSIDTLLKPFYEGTILAWMEIKSLARAQNSGWSRYFEYFQEGSGKAYTINSLMVLREGFYATRTYTASELNVRDGAPFLIGDQGKGHLFLGDRGGYTIAGDPTGRIYIERVQKLSLAWSREASAEWSVTFGSPLALEDAVARAWARIERLQSAVHELGVF
ncbi:hypothetical protein RhoFasGS6_03912 [Rhodococcus fascians]|uniref:Gp37-like protein n=1 Tax=Rhodococcoides fascians TaxID=1828 RepID=UPI001427C091|nr:hypothetical protein [Rhodococcus fascians]